MKIFNSILSLLGRKFDIWLTKVGEANRPVENEHSHLQNDCSIIGQSDLMYDENGG